MSDSARLTLDQYAVMLAATAAARSEDPYLKVGAVALSWDNRVIATAYNGLVPGFKPPPGFWEDREGRRRYMIHAEVNLCSLVRRREAATVAITSQPCPSCAATLLAHDVKKVLYVRPYRDPSSADIFKFYGVDLVKVTLPTRLATIFDEFTQVIQSPDLHGPHPDELGSQVGTHEG